MKKYISVIGVLSVHLFGCQTQKETATQQDYVNTDLVSVKIVVNDSVIDRGDVFRIIEPLWWTIDIMEGEDVYQEDAGKFTDNQRYAFAIEWYFGEVSVSGHDKFFSHSTRVIWQDALAGFKAIGLTRNYEILKAAADSVEEKSSTHYLDLSDVDFKPLDDEFFAADSIGVEEKLLEFIKANRKDFYFEGMVEKPKDY